MCRGQLPDGLAGDRKTDVALTIMLDELEWPSMEARRKHFSLTFYKIHSGLEKDKNLTPAPN